MTVVNFTGFQRSIIKKEAQNSKRIRKIITRTFPLVLKLFNNLKTPPVFVNMVSQAIDSVNNDNRQVTLEEAITTIPIKCTIT